jgi:hypothetical protein
MPDKKLTDSNLIKTCKDCFHYEPCFSGGVSMWNNIEQTPEDCCQYFVPTPEKETYNGMDFCGVPCEFMEDIINRLQEEKEALINGQETLQKYIADLQAENERLKNNGKLESENIVLNSLIEMKNDTICNLMKTVYELESQLKTAKAEAYKEFAERLKTKASDFEFGKAVWVVYIDDLLKEMVGE